MLNKLVLMVSQQETKLLTQHTQVVRSLLDEAEKSFGEGDAIRGGIFTASILAFLEIMIPKVNIMAPIQIGSMENGEGKRKADEATTEATNMIKEFEKLYKAKKDGKPDTISN